MRQSLLDPLPVQAHHHHRAFVHSLRTLVRAADDECAKFKMENSSVIMPQFESTPCALTGSVAERDVETQAAIALMKFHVICIPTFIGVAGSQSSSVLARVMSR
jgi:hypothetical protein